MKSVQLVHTADLHLGTPFSLFPEKAALLQKEQLQMLMEICSVCRKNNVHLLLIAGDFFESVDPPESLIQETCAILQSIPDTHIFISPGNHDPAEPESAWLKLSWPHHVHIFSGGLEYHELPDLQTRVYGAAFRSTAAPDPLLKSSEYIPDPDWLNILLIHGDLVSTGQSSAYNPLSRDWLSQSGFDYIALGHVHQGFLPRRLGSGGPWYAYPGCPAARGFDERASEGILSGILRKAGRTQCDLVFTRVAKRHFRQLNVDISDCTGLDDIIRSIKRKSDTVGASWSDDAFKVILTGAPANDFKPGMILLKANLETSLFYLRLVDRTTARINLPVLAQEHSLAGAFVRQIIGDNPAVWEELAHEQQEIIHIGLRAFDQEVLYHED